jgi:hypothetical protein
MPELRVGRRIRQPLNKHGRITSVIYRPSVGGAHSTKTGMRSSPGGRTVVARDFSPWTRSHHLFLSARRADDRRNSLRAHSTGMVSSALRAGQAGRWGVPQGLKSLATTVRPPGEDQHR